jgi:hypothetical protein
MKQIKPNEIESSMLGFITLQLALDTLEDPNFEGNQKANRKNLEAALREIEPQLNKVFNQNAENSTHRQLWINYRNASRELERHLSITGKVPARNLQGLRACHSAAKEWVENIEFCDTINPLSVIEQYEDLADRMFDLILISLRISGHKNENKIDAALNRLIEKYELK